MNYCKLPKGYKRILKIELEKDKMGTVFVSSLSVFLMLLMLLIGVFLCGSDYLKTYIFVDTPQEYYKAFHRLFLGLAGLFVFAIVRELMRIVIFKLMCKNSRIKLKRKNLYFYIASSGYFSKRSYMFISFLPVVLMGAVLLYLCFAVPEKYFISVYFILILNVSSISGDLYLWYFISRFDKNLLIKDTGETVCFYSKV